LRVRSVSRAHAWFWAVPMRRRPAITQSSSTANPATRKTIPGSSSECSLTRSCIEPFGSVPSSPVNARSAQPTGRVIAQSMRAPTIRILPASLQEQLKSDAPLERMGAAFLLRDLIMGSDTRTSEAAQKALERLTGDDSKLVAAAAERLFGEMPAEHRPAGTVTTSPLSESALPPALKDALLNAGTTPTGSPVVPGRPGTVTRALVPTSTLPCTDAASREVSIPELCRTEIMSRRGAESTAASTCFNSAMLARVVRTTS